MRTATHLLLATCALAAAVAPTALQGARSLPRLRSGAPVCQESSAEEVREGGGPALPFLSRRPLPEQQQPVNAFQDLTSKPFFDWPMTDEYNGKLFNLYLVMMAIVGLPVAYTTFDVLPKELPQLFLSANIGTLAVAMLPFTIRLRWGWGFISGRLKKERLYYEQQERGFFARKDRESQFRDQQLRQTQVLPVLLRIDFSIAAVIAALVLSLASGEVLTVSLGEAGPATLKTLTGDAAIQFDTRLRRDNDFAAREQRRQQERRPDMPAYCDSRYYRILAGGNSQGGVGCGGQN